MRICAFIAMLVPGIALGAFERTQAGARPAALSNAFVALADDPWAMFTNPAGLTQIPFATLSVFHSPQPFGLPELSTTAAAASAPTSAGTIGLAVRRSGVELYRRRGA